MKCTIKGVGGTGMRGVQECEKYGSELDRFHMEAKGLSINPVFPKLGVYPSAGLQLWPGLGISVKP
jgi:hypothetical protein